MHNANALQRFFRFIFMHRSWAADKDHLTQSLGDLARQATAPGSRAPLWLLIFPEGTITSDDERAKSVRYADKQGVVRLQSRDDNRSAN